MMRRTLERLRRFIAMPLSHYADALAMLDTSADAMTRRHAIAAMPPDARISD